MPSYFSITLLLVKAAGPVENVVDLDITDNSGNFWHCFLCVFKNFTILIAKFLIDCFNT